MFSKTRLKRRALVGAARAVRYAKTHKLEMVQLGVMALVVFMPEYGFCKPANGEQTGGFDVIADPMEKLSTFMTGKGAKVAATIGASAGIGAWTINTDNQIVKNGMRLTAGTGALLAVPGLVSAVAGYVIP